MRTARSGPACRWPLVGVLLLAASGARAADGWVDLGAGLELGRFALERAGAPGAQVHVLRIDPRRWELTLHGLPRGESFGHTAREWARREGLVAAINAGMYHEDYRTHSGYFAADGTVLSRGVNGYLSAAAFEPTDPADRQFRIFDLDEDPLASVLPRYRRVVQNLRMIKRPGENRWSPPERRWSEASLGEDREGRALFIFCAAAVPLDELIERLLALPLGIVAAQHLEGGSQAQLYVETGTLRLELVGAREGTFAKPVPDFPARPVPNVIGVRRRASGRER